MIIVAFILWMTMWGLAGYFVARAIQTRIEYRRTIKIIKQLQESCPGVNRVTKEES